MGTAFVEVPSRKRMGSMTGITTSCFVLRRGEREKEPEGYEKRAYIRKSVFTPGDLLRQSERSQSVNNGKDHSHPQRLTADRIHKGQLHELVEVDLSVGTIGLYGANYLLP